ncbi:MAG: ABC transporter permease [Planctomycetota bacterium]
MTRWTELRELTRQRVLVFLRQPEAVFWVFAFPLVLAAVLGFAFQSSEPRTAVVGVLDGIEGDLSPLESDPRLEIVRFDEAEEAERALRVARVDALLLAVDGGEGVPTLRLDPTRDEAETARLRVIVALSDADLDGATIEPLTERGSRYVDFLFPGLLGMNLMGTGIWSIGFAVAEMRQRKLLKRYLVTPMRRSSFLASFLLSRLIFLALELLALVLFAVFVLGVPMRGDLPSFAIVSVLGAVTFAGLGLLTAARTKTIEGASGMMNLVMMPMWLVSGIFFSYERFPDVVHPLIKALPLTALNDALRKSMLEGLSIVSMGPEIAVMTLWLVAGFAIALRVFRWK